MDKNKNKRLFCESLFGSFDKIIAELEMVYNLTHNGEKGREAEEILRSFLSTFLPKKYQVGTGFVRSDLGVSNQSDILIYDGINIPPIYSGYVNKIIQLYSLRSVIECKMNLLVESIEKQNLKFASIKDMYRKDEEIQSIIDEPLTVLFAYKKIGNIKAKLDSLPVRNIDMVFCGEGELYINGEDGYTNNLCDGIYYGQTIHGYSVTKSQQAFAVFYSHFIDRLNKMKFDYSRVSMMYEYSKSAVYIDYKDL
ncbi:DUF6602 domain-containing protein [Niallia sp. 03091]|uniref:DUF6602 domain-containing protein n=1 Tax=Niallia sp. 03091 TaxID=3458059 RepID=UPI0040449FB9